MISFDKDALICDLAETYGIYDYRALPVQTLAVLCIGLRDNSRIKMKLSGVNAPSDVMLLAAAVDRLSLLVWAKTEDGRKNRNRPKSMVNALNKTTEEGEKKILSFVTGKEYEEARKIIAGGG